MIKKLIDMLKEEELSPNSFFLLAQGVLDYDVELESECSFVETLKHLERKKFIKITNYETFEYSYRQKGIDFVKKIEKEFTEVNVVIKEKPGVTILSEMKNVALEIKDWIEEYRDLFKGLKPGVMGDKNACLNKMVRFFKEYPEYANKDIILKATQNYIQVEAHQNYKFLQKADYFIFKLVGKEETSRLASFCGEVDEKQVESFTKML